MKKLIFKFLSYFVGTKFWIYISRNFISKLTFRIFGYPKFPIDKYFEIRNILRKEGNNAFVFVGADKQSATFKLNHLFTGCMFGHAGVLYLDDSDEVRMIHMLGSGLNDDSLLDYLKEVDRIAILKLKFKSTSAKNKFFDRLEKTLKNKDKIAYDFEFKIEENIDDFISKLDKSEQITSWIKPYCSEYVLLLGYNLVDNPNFKEKTDLLRKTFEPDDLYKSGTVYFEYL